jgi:hypothetical protein
MAFNLSPRGTNNIKTGHGLPGGLIKPSSPLNQSKKVIDNAFRQPSKKEPSFWDSAVNAVSEAVSNVGDYFSGDTQTTTTKKPVVKRPIVKKETKKIYTDTAATYTKGSRIPGSNMNYGNGTQMRIPSSVGVMSADDVEGKYKKGHHFAETITSSSDAERKKPLTSFINKSGSAEEQAADKSFIQHYSDPVTLKRMEKAGINPKWAYDLTKKAITTPKINETGKKANLVPSDAEGVYHPIWNQAVAGKSYTFNPWYTNKGEIDTKKKLGKEGAISYRESSTTPTKGTIEHEMAHASYADVLWPSLYKALGKKAPRLDNKKMYVSESYMNRPTEVYAHFHEFRQNLGIKPGQKISQQELVRRVKANPKVEGGKFWQHYGQEVDAMGKPTKEDKNFKAKLTNAVNTVASNNAKKKNKMQFSANSNSGYA